jgi:hypothetical protein
MRNLSRVATVIGVASLVVSCAGGTPQLESASSHDTTHEPPADDHAPRDATEREVGDPQAEFWANLRALCGKAFAGELVEGTEEGDQALAGVRLVIDAHTCEGDEIRIGFYAGADRSRTWVFQRGEGLSLAHDHRQPDGTPDEVTAYGGPALDQGTPSTQEFHADAHTAKVAPEAATNIWTLQLDPGERLTYSLRRRVGDRRFRAEFNLATEIDADAP